MANVKFEYNGLVSSAGLNSWDRQSDKRVTVELNDDDLTVDEMLNEFMNFMQAIGYSFELGDRFEVVNDFKIEKKDNLKIDFSKYGSSEPGYGAVPPQPIIDEGGTLIGIAENKQYIPSQEELDAEVERIRSGKPGLSEEAYEMAAYTNLTNKRV